MAIEIPFRREFSFEYGRLEPVAPMIRRIVARNPSPFTFRGTGTYVVGHGEVAVIDPGPDLAEHVEALLVGLAGEQVTHILITHTHRDHSPAARALQAATGAPTYGFGPHAGGKRGDPAVEEGGDWDFVPDRILGDGDRIIGKGWVFEAVHTPGHTSNHVCFALPADGVLFSGDHVMGWSTSVIAPPDGDMAAYVGSLRELLRDEAPALEWLAPGHGFLMAQPARAMQALVDHRMRREAKVLDALRQHGGGDLDALLVPVYADVAPHLHRPAKRSLLAHLLKLEKDGVAVDVEGRWSLKDAAHT